MELGDLGDVAGECEVTCDRGDTAVVAYCVKTGGAPGGGGRGGIFLADVVDEDEVT